ncbi:putative tocopherol O-methyltransferase, chloroplastic [Apostasia shenzhenica]|uniref:Putative tocopherol O-methyltransferase, chloroplastic n=1 Tax=Apostasia shenzhenica TaxID=1088818 RepID=A0A2I0A9F5_9ASPA|nr:putative tocopherol O-methyltransferase, chloroplastic [Apostasia shenzhenica]
MAAGELKKGIAEYYDESGKAFEALWGDHIHHGFYDPERASPLSAADHQRAPLRTVEEALAFAGITDDPVQKRPKMIVDVGCGIGGSARYLAKRFGAQIQAITLSPIQVKRAQDLAMAEGLANQITFQLADALDQPFPDGQFDLVWSMESGEYMPDKEKFMRELVRVAAPGGTIIIVTWCHRDLSPTEENLKPEEIKLMTRICNAYYMPRWCSAADYLKIANSLSLENIKMGDWSENIAPFWPAAIRSALTWRGVTSLLRCGWKTVKGALAMPLMIEGYNKKLIKYVIITCHKPI